MFRLQIHLGMLGLASLLLGFSASSSAPGWPEDAAINLPICTASSHQTDPRIIVDGTGGAIITWDDRRNDVYSQRISIGGDILWVTDGVLVSGAVGVQAYPRIAPDADEGAIICWSDRRNGVDWDVYAQRIDRAGSVVWPLDAAIVSILGDQTQTSIAPDGCGGAIIAWEDFRNDTISDVYAQRICGDGTTLWITNGVAVCTALNSQRSPDVLSDGFGGAIIVWQDARDASTNDEDIYAQRIGADGSLMWLADGVPVCTARRFQEVTQLVSGGASGVIIIWDDGRNSATTGTDIFAQHMDNTGSPSWEADGVPVCTAPGTQRRARADIVGSGGFVAAWTDHRSDSTGWDIYSQRVDSNGTRIWLADGVAVCTEIHGQDRPQVISNGSERAIIVWEDFRTYYTDVYAQQLGEYGDLRWTQDGVPISTAAWVQQRPRLVPDNTGGAIIVWEDWRNGGLYVNHDIYAQRVGSEGNLGDPTGIISSPWSQLLLAQNYPNPFNPSTTISFVLPGPSDVNLGIFDVRGKLVLTLFNGTLPTGPNEIRWDGRDTAGNVVSSGVYFYQLRANGLSQTRKMLLLR